MKSIALVLTLANLAACGTRPTSSPLSSAFQSRVFSHDGRPADGVLTEITIANQLGTKKFDISLLTAIVDRTTGKSLESTEVLGNSLDCIFNDAKITCQKDGRLADGILTEIKLIKESHEWTASIRTAFFDRQLGKEVDETKQIDSRLIEQKQNDSNNNVNLTKSVLSCKGSTSDKNPVTLEINTNSGNGSLVIGETSYENKAVKVKCVAPLSDNQRRIPDAPSQLWSCVEDRLGDGKLYVSIHTQGMMSLKIAEVSQEQIFGVEPKELATLVCK